MAYDDWKNNMSTLLLNVDFPEDWTGVRFEASWWKKGDLMNAVGLPRKYE